MRINAVKFEIFYTLFHCAGLNFYKKVSLCVFAAFQISYPFHPHTPLQSRWVTEDHGGRGLTAAAAKESL